MRDARIVFSVRKTIASTDTFLWLILRMSSPAAFKRKTIGKKTLADAVILEAAKLTINLKIGHGSRIEIDTATLANNTFSITLPEARKFARIPRQC